jgi:hypothetical protein
MARLQVRDFGKSINFTSTNGATIPYTPNLTAFSVAFWIKKNRNVASSRYIDWQNAGPANGFRIEGEPTPANGSRLGFLVDTSGSDTEIFTEVPIGEYHHIACTFSFDGVNAVSKIYKDSILQATNSVASSGIISSSSTLKIGNRSTGTSNPAEAKLDDILFYDKELTALEIENLYFYGLVPDALAAGYNANDNMLDISGNGHNATVTGATYSPDVFMVGRQSIADFGYCLEFDGSTSKIDLDSMSFGASLSQITWGGWINTNSIGATQYLMTRPAGTSDQIGLTSANKLTMALNIGGNQALNGNAVLERNTWYFYVGTYDGANIRLFLDGKLDAVSGSLSGGLTNTGTTWDIGQRGGAAFFKGRMARQFFMDRALSEEEIYGMYISKITPNDSSLKGYWKLDENTGTTAVDSSGNGNDGVITSGIYVTSVPFTTRTTASNRIAVRDMGTALRFDGAGLTSENGDFVSISNASLPGTLFNQTSFSMGCWYRIDGLASVGPANAQHIMGKYAGGAPEFNLIYAASSRNIRAFTRSTTQSATVEVPQPIASGWYHAIMVVDYPNLTNTLYVNGVAVAQGLCVTGDTSATQAFTIGKASTSGETTARPVNGIIDEPRIWSRALTAQEVSDLYLNNIVPREGLVAEYLFNEATGTTATDSSGNGNNGTISGATYTTDVAIIPREEV